jgi:ribosomal protein S18 acetylase RimI-like enzyme
VKIRTATPRDLDAIVEVFRACWNLSYAELLPNEVRADMTQEKAREMWGAAVTSHPDRTSLVVELEDLVVAIARIGIDPNDGKSGHLFSLYVHPGSSGQGIGRALLNEAMKRLSEQGVTRRTLWVFRDNAIAQKLYSSFGFIPSGAEKTDPRWKIPEIEMELTAPQ